MAPPCQRIFNRSSFGSWPLVNLAYNIRQPGAGHAAWRIAARSAAQAHGIGSSMREAGQRLTSFVSTSVK
jgi:hypothetical protein